MARKVEIRALQMIKVDRGHRLKPGQTRVVQEHFASAKVNRGQAEYVNGPPGRRPSQAPTRKPSNQPARVPGETKPVKPPENKPVEPSEPKSAPLPDYEDLTVEEVLTAFEAAGGGDDLARQLITYEQDHDGRKTLITALERKID